MCVLGYPCEPHNNPADFFLDVINGDFTATAKMHSSEGNDHQAYTMITAINMMNLETLCTYNSAIANIISTFLLRAIPISRCVHVLR